jgi:HEPN domain-containing protein
MAAIFTPAVTAGFFPFLEKIIRISSPEKVFLLSVSHQRKCVQTIFLENSFEYQTPASYEILVLTPESAKRSHYELQDIIESQISDSLSITAIVLPVRQFNDWLGCGHPFVLKVFTRALLCYDAGNSPLSDPGQRDKESIIEELQQEFDRHCGLAAEFFAGTELFVTRKNYRMAAFNLHQAAEQTYAGIIHLLSGWRVQTHSLDKLCRYAQYLQPGLAELFPRNTEAERRLFRFLQKAYSDTRYKKDYYIKYPELLILKERIKKLLDLCQNMKHSTPITF